MTMTQKFTLPVLGALMLLGGSIAGYVGMASAQSATNTDAMQAMRAPHVDGTITNISGSTITITADANHGGGTYTIDASNATFTKAGASATIANFASGEKIWAMGTINGTAVTATSVTDQPGFGRGGPGHGKGPGVMGEVTAVDGSSITVSGKDGQSYTVDAGSAAVKKMVAGSISDVQVGDTIGVRGTVSGTSVTATEIMDDLPQAGAQQ